LNRNRKAPTATPALALAALVVASLTACGGGSAVTEQAEAADATTTAAAASSTAPSDLEAQLAQASATPTYHMAPVVLPEPDESDVGGTNASAHVAPQRFAIDPSVADLPTRGLTPQILAEHLASARMHVASAQVSAGSAAATRSLASTVFTPAQIRAAYGLPDLPAITTSLTPAQAANLGAGQTIYIIDAYHDATALADLNVFSTKFGLPTCTQVGIAPTAALPLGAASSKCTLSVVEATSSGTMTSTVPAYSGTWAPESKLDVQWAHAIAPLARIVLIETPNSMSNYILGAIALANKMGPGVVSMSFAFPDPGWAASVDSRFTTPGMTYLAATGDVGGQVAWPAVSPNVVAVGGTGMNWSPATGRYEQAWASGGGGVSAYESAPSYQADITVGGAKPSHRAVADVAFNANPTTGQYVSLTLPNAAQAWSAYGGTSIGTPQWAGIIAVANAIRANAGKNPLGDIHSLLYGSIGAVPGNYSAAFADIVDGTNGSCTICKATAGFDTATGWGTPNVSALMPLLTGGASAATAAAPAISVPGGSLTGKASVALSASLGITAPAGSTTYTVSGAPSGATVDATGTLRWPAPVAGTFTFTVKATSGNTSASGSYTLSVAANTSTANHAPTFGSHTEVARTSTAFKTTLVGRDADGDALTYSVTGAPAGLTVTSAGVVSWAHPTAGTHDLMVTVHDSHGATGTGVLVILGV
jgi:subtilase family serine protease